MPQLIEVPGYGEVEFPDDMSDEQISQAIRQNMSPQPTQQTVSPVEGMSGPDRFFAGMGKAVADIGRGAHQAAGELAPYLMAATGKPTRQDVGQAIGAPTAEEIDEIKKRDAPLMKTKAGVLGNVSGNILAAIPAAFTPGANTAAGAALIGGGLGATQPVGTGDSRALNTGLGAAFGAAGQQVGARVIPGAIKLARGRVASKAAEKTANAARDATIAEARQAGYVLPPSEVNAGPVSNLLERWAGKASVGQQASLKNQQVTNKLVRDTLGLPKDTPITPEALEPIKQAAWSVYDQTRKLGQLTPDADFGKAIAELAKKSTKLNPIPGVDDLVSRLNQGTFDADDVVTAIQSFRANASTRLGQMNTDPVTRNLGKAEAKAADALEGLIERNIGGDLLKNFKNARVTLGKVGTVERALVESTGDVSAKKLAAVLAKGKPLSGEMRTAAKFAQAFPKLAQQNVNPVPGGSPLDAVAAIGTSAATSNPAWLALALGRPAARSAVLSPMFAGAPNYSPGVTAKALPYLLDPLNNRATAQGLGLLGPSIYAAQQ